MKELTLQEMTVINAGEPPMASYMSERTINALATFWGDAFDFVHGVYDGYFN